MRYSSLRKPASPRIDSARITVLKQAVEDANNRRHELNRKAEASAQAAHDATRCYHDAVDRLEAYLEEVGVSLECG